MGQLALLVLSGILVLLNTGPMYLQLLQGNSGPISMGVWVMLENLNDFVSQRVRMRVIANFLPDRSELLFGTTIQRILPTSGVILA